MNNLTARILRTQISSSLPKRTFVPESGRTGSACTKPGITEP